MRYQLLFLCPFSLVFGYYEVTLSSDTLPNGVPGELRDAINSVNDAAAMSAEIRFDMGLGTIQLSTSLPPILVPVTITGNGIGDTVIDGNNQYGIFFFTPVSYAGLIDVSVSDMTLQNGVSLGGAGGSGMGTYANAAGGGAMGAGAGVFASNATIAIDNVAFTNLHANGGAGGSTSGTNTQSFLGCGGGGMLGGVGGTAGFTFGMVEIIGGSGGGGGIGVGATGGVGGDETVGPYGDIGDGGVGLPGIGSPFYDGQPTTGGHGYESTGVPSASGAGGASGGADGGTSPYAGGGGAQAGGGGGGCAGSFDVNTGGGGGGGLTLSTICGGSTGVGGDPMQPFGQGGIGGGGGGGVHHAYGGEGGIGGGGGGGSDLNGGTSMYGGGGGGGGGGGLDPFPGSNPGGHGGGRDWINQPLGGNGGSSMFETFEASQGGGGGGGAGLGGAIFVLGSYGTVLTLTCSGSTFPFSMNNVLGGSPGTGGGGSGGTGQALGMDIFVGEGGVLSFDVSMGVTQTFSGDLSGDGSGAFNTNGPGTLIITNFIECPFQYALNSGTLLIENSIFLDNNNPDLTSASSIALGTGTQFGFTGISSYSFGGVSDFYSGITGAGGLFMQGTGAIQLTSSNFYTGGTTINSGVLSIAAPSYISDAGSFLVLNGGTLQTTASMALVEPVTLDASGGTFDLGTTTLTLSGQITSTGALAQLGTGTLVLANGSNNYSGLTTVNGTLRAGATNGFSPDSDISIGGSAIVDLYGFNNTIPSFSGSMGSVITSTNGSATLSVDNSAPISFPGTIEGPIDLHLIGTSSLTLTEPNSYTGGTTIDLGTALDLTGSGAISSTGTVTDNGTFNISGVTTSATIGNLAGSGSVILGDKTLITDTSANTIFSGQISGVGGALTVEGANSLTLTETNTYTGPTTISSGSLFVDGSITSSVTVDSSGTLSGTGTIHGDVSVTGTYTPGGYYYETQTIDGTLAVEIGGTFFDDITPTIPNAVTVNGPVTIASGTTFIVNPNGGTYTIPFEYPTPVITSTSPISGTFSTVTFLTLIPASLIPSSDGKELFLQLGSPTPVSIFVSSGNAGKVAIAIDAIVAAGGDEIDTLFSSLVNLPADQLYNALNEMQPAQYKGAAIAQENNAVLVRNALSMRMQTILDTERSFFESREEKPAQPALSEINERRTPLVASMGYLGDDVCEQMGKKVHVWMSGVGDFLHQGGTNFFDSPQYGYQVNSEGLIAGADYAFRDHFYLGALGAYTHSVMNWGQDQGKAYLDSGYGGLYASAINEIFYANLCAVGSWTNYDESRNIIYPGVFLKEKNSHHGQQIISHLDAGINLRYKGFTLRPFDSLDWLWQRENGYKETGGGEWDLSTNSTRSSFLRNELGLDFVACVCAQKLKWAVDAKVSWVRETRISGKTAQSAFSVAPTFPFTVIGFFPNRNLISVGGTLTAVGLKDRLSAALYYNGVFGHKYSENSVGLQVSLGF